MQTYQSDGRRGTVIEDLLRVAAPATPRLDPTGRTVAYVLRAVDGKRNAVIGRIHVVPADGSGESVAWTRGPGSESDPRWSPDGKWLGFVSTREEKVPALYRLPVAGGEASRMLELPEGSLGAWAFSPDGAWVAFTFRAADPERTRAAAEVRAKENRSTPPRLIERIQWRSEGAGFLPPERYRLGIAPVGGGDIRWLAGEPDRDIGDFAWTPDGAFLLHAIPAAEDPDRRGSDMQWRLVNVASGAARVVPAPPGPKESPVFAPDGATFAWMGHDDPDETWGVRNVHPWTTRVEDGHSIDLAAGTDVTAGDCTLGELWARGDQGPAWDDAGRVFCLVSDHGRVFLEAFTAEGVRERVAEDIGGFSVGGGRTALLRHSAVDAGEVWVDEVRLTDCNRDWLSEVRLVEPIRIEPPAPDGAPVPCFVLLPADHAQDPRPRPCLLYLHGGPHLMYGERRLFHEYQALAAAGYVVLFPNPRGSKGYGEAWTRAIEGDWGDPAMHDVLACVDHAVAAGWADPDRLGILGGSYGGYLTAWVVGRTDRFKAAAPERGVYDLVSMAGTTDFAWRDHDCIELDLALGLEFGRELALLSLGGLDHLG
ncbi:MAG: prolyl oligopeptidase family serine peptidase, partial [Armatimonadota bacterium]